MALESYRRQRVISNSANADFDKVIMLNAGDVEGRIVRFEAAKGNGRAATACKLWIDKGEGLAVFCELIRVDMPTPTWEAAIPVRGLAVGMYDAAIRLEDVDGSITETMPIRVQVVGSILAESEATEEMQDALDDFEIRTRAALEDIAEAITEAEAATTDAQAATTSATGAAQAANTAAQNIGAEVDAQGILTVTDADGTTTTYDGAATAAQSATSAAERATDAAISAETAAGNIAVEVDSSGVVTVTDADGTQTTYDGLADAVLLARGAAERADDAAVNANAAKTAANSAAISANSAAESANEAASSATEAAASATDAASTATEAATAATNAATSASNAATAATTATTNANTATTNANTATTNANSATTAANEAAASATDAATAAIAAAEDATDAATEARDAAAAALASAGNTVLGEISMLDGSIETVDDAFVSPIRGIEVSGKSTQASISGSQIWRPDASADRKVVADCTVSGYSVMVEATSGSSWPYVIFTVPGIVPMAGESYTISATSDNFGYIYFSAVDENNTVIVGGNTRDSQTKNPTITLNIPTDATALKVNLYARTTSAGAEGDSTTFSNIMLNSGSTALPFEPYVGGIPSPNPDFPQTIHSVADAGQVITGRCVWGGEKMADDIVAAVGDATKAYKGEDSHGKYVVVVGSVPVRGKIFFNRVKANSQYTFILHSRKNVSNAGANLLFNYTDGTADGLSVAPLVEEGVIYTYPSVSRQGKSLASVGGTWTSGTTYIYYEQSGLFEGVLSNDDFAPYLGTTTPLIPSGVEPLRSLQDGTRDELVVHEDGSREIIRRVGKYAFGSSDLWSLRHTTEESGIRTFSISLANKLDYLYTRTSASGSLCNAFTNLGIIIGISGMYNKGVGFALLISAGGEKMMYANVLGIETEAEFNQMTQNVNLTVYAPLAVEVIEPLPSITMPAAPSSDVTAWLDSKDEDSAPIATDSSVSYERSLQIVIDKLEQAIADL